MLSPDQEIHPAYLRTLRQTLTDVISPEVASPAGRNTLKLCDFILVRMIAALEELPGVQDARATDYQSCLAEAASLLGDGIAPPPRELSATAAELQRKAGRLFARLNAARPEETARITALLARISATDAAFRQAYERSGERVTASHETPLQSLEITATAVQAYLDRRFPAGGLRVRELHQIPGGRSKLTVMLSLEPNELLPSGIVLRFDNPGSAQNTAVRDEYPVMRAMYDQGVCAPEPLWLEPDTAPLGASFLAMRRMEGTTPGDYWSAAGVAPELGLALASALAGLHAPRAGSVWPAAPEHARDAVAAMVDDLESRWHASGEIPSVTMACAYGWLRRHLGDIEGPAVPVHGDVHFGNMLAEGHRLTCLTDWEFCHPGHPAEDIAFCRGYIEQIMPWDAFLAQYQASGGASITDRQIRFFAVWGLLRNITFAAAVLGSFTGGTVHDIQNLSIGLNSRARLEAVLAKTIAEEMAGDAAT